jgi:hypothetical protein
VWQSRATAEEPLDLVEGAALGCQVSTQRNSQRGEETEEQTCLGAGAFFDTAPPNGLASPGEMGSTSLKRTRRAAMQPSANITEPPGTSPMLLPFALRIAMVKVAAITTASMGLT